MLNRLAQISLKFLARVDRRHALFAFILELHLLFTQLPQQLFLSVLDRLLFPGFRTIARGFTWLRARVQNGLVAIYLFYVALTLFVLLLLLTTY